MDPAPRLSPVFYKRKHKELAAARVRFLSSKSDRAGTRRRGQTAPRRALSGAFAIGATRKTYVRFEVYAC
jgi:hypothetical protein